MLSCQTRKHTLYVCSPGTARAGIVVWPAAAVAVLL